LPNVACIGGSFVTPAAAMTARDWPAITALAARASQL
jgi:2-dehydro-3-deoxyphosphogluconate aldolase/(4S)-4-hydroxy-2-oxoglutarate aldolase